VTHWLRFEAVLERSFAFHFLLGFMALPVIQLLAHSVLPGSLATQLVAIAGLAGLGRLRDPWRATVALERDHQRRAQAWAQLFLVVLSLLVPTCWSRALLVSEDIRADHVIYRSWIDFFEHASVVPRILAGENLWRMGHYALAGLPAP
jgi:hypothetical protein